MDLQVFRNLTILAREGSFSRSATKIGIAQPTLSKQMRGLETELGVNLFHRHGHEVTPTAAGQRLLDVVVPLLHQFDAVRAELMGNAREPQGHVKFGVPPSIGATIIAPMVVRLRRTHPQVLLHVVEGFSGSLFEWVESGRIDIAILYDARRSAAMSVAPVLLEELFWIRSGAHAKQKASTRLADIDLRSLILPGKGNGLRRVVDAAFRRRGVDLQVASEIDSVAVLKQLVAAGAGDTILPFGAVYREVSDGILTASPIGDADVQAMLVIATTLNRAVTQATLAVISAARQEFADSVAKGILRGTLKGRA